MLGCVVCPGHRMVVVMGFSGGGMVAFLLRLRPRATSFSVLANMLITSPGGHGHAGCGDQEWGGVPGGHLA